MRFDPQRADIKFGCGLSPRYAPARSVDEVLERVTGPDHAAAAFPIGGFDEIVAAQQRLRRANRAKNEATSEAAIAAAVETRRAARRAVQHKALGWLRQSLMRRAATQDGLRERLVAFWSDHFTVKGRFGAWRSGTLPYVEEAIRPHVTGRFADMLRAASMHPMMLLFLDQHRSIGPQSRAAQRRKGRRGLNENLARELMELHTLGVDAPYDQADVRELAELLTGLSYNNKKGFWFNKNAAEPGAETILGKVYGGHAPRIEDIWQVLDDLAGHPATAHHIARKLAVHFVSDNPDAELVSALATRFTETGGDLFALYATLLSHPAAWVTDATTVKQPVDFIGSALRALDLSPRHLPADGPDRIVNLIGTPLALMGQEWGRPPGPDGWPEADEAWITPQRLAARLQWALSAPVVLRRNLPDPRDFVEVALGHTAPEAVRFAARAAETRAEGVAVVLASPAFQRM